MEKLPEDAPADDNSETSHEGLTTEEFKAYVSVDDEVLTSEAPTDEDILSEVRGTPGEDSDNDTEVTEESEPPTKATTLKDAQAACEVLRSFLMGQHETSDELESLCKIDNLLSKVKRSSVKQLES